MKVVTIVGARPQFIKAAVVSHELRKKDEEILVHTGQHFDYNMSEQFFEELDIPKPDYNLGISGGNHSEMTGRMMIEIDKVLREENPDWLLLYGDTNSTLAGALAAAKLYIPICHVEAGNRGRSGNNPEEINRICTDHLSKIALACTQSSMNNLIKEGLGDRSSIIGDPMYDAFLEYGGKANRDAMELHGLEGDTFRLPKRYFYLTCHREENTSNDEDLKQILDAMNNLPYPTVYPVHPRNKERALRLNKEYGYDKKIYLVEPVGYLESICICKNAEKIVTDSGGLQREAFFAGKQCVTILNFEAWPETMVSNRNQLSKPITEEILTKLNAKQLVDETYQPFGDGHSAVKIVQALEG